LIANGHPGAWDYSPRQALAYAELLTREENRRTLATFMAVRLAFGGDENAVRKFVEALEG